VPRPGRRRGSSDTRAGILAAAQAEFLETGYATTTIRAIARRAEVDPALVYHYFGDKPNLYVETLRLPADPAAIRRAMPNGGDGGDGGDRSGRSPGTRLVERFLAQWEDDAAGPQGQGWVTMAQAVSTSPEAARGFREFLTERVWTDAATDDVEAHWQRAVISSQLAGLAWNRYVLRAEPLASATRQEIAARVGPTIDRLLKGLESPESPESPESAARPVRRSRPGGRR